MKTLKSFFITFALLIINITVFAQPKVGTKTPEVALPDANGQIVSLSSLKGKVILLDFWASWCGPCRRNNKETVSLYEQYKDKGFEVLGVSIDENKEAWQKAVAQDKMTWKQVIDTQAGFGNELTKTWNLQYIPSTFLINKQGKIVAVAPEKDELEKLLKKLL